MVNPGNPEQENTVIHELVRRSVGGDLGAFRSLLESQERYAYALAFKLLHDEEEVKDVVQEAFIRVWNNLARYRPQVRFTTWLYKIVVNLCYDRMKMESRRKNIFGYSAGWFASDEIADGGDIHEEIEKRDLREFILSAAKKLPPMERLIFHLRDVQDCSVEETAEIAGISIGSVKTNLCYARKRIRLTINEHRNSKHS